MTFLEQMIELFSLPFAPRIFIVGILISLCAALLGVPLVLKRYSLIGHGLADVGFAALSLALALGLPPLAVSMPVVLAASVIIMAYSQKKGVAGDVAIGIAATASLAVGIMITALTHGFNIDVYGYMFGSILAISESDVVLSIILSALVIGLFIMFYNRLFLITSDEAFAIASGIRTTAYQFLLSLLTALTVVIGMRLVGTLLISSLIIFPTVSAKKIARSYKSLVILASVISVICLIIGVLCSFALNLPTGASIVGANILVMLILTIYKIGSQRST